MLESYPLEDDVGTVSQLLSTPYLLGRHNKFLLNFVVQRISAAGSEQRSSTTCFN